MPLNFVIVIDDAGTLSTVQSVELDKEHPAIAALLDAALNKTLDDRAIEAGDYTPEGLEEQRKLFEEALRSPAMYELVKQNNALLQFVDKEKPNAN